MTLLALAGARPTESETAIVLAAARRLPVETEAQLDEFLTQFATSILVMSALPPKADMCGATWDVCFGPIADIATKSELLT
jgi:hypothetical protein